MKRNYIKKGGRTQQVPDGEVRASQMITTYGPGALVDLVQHSVLIKDASAWRYVKGMRGSSEYAIVEERLQRSIEKRVEWFRPEAGSAAFSRPPLSRDEQHGSHGVPANEFPARFVCTRCREILGRYALGARDKRGRYIHDCVLSVPGSTTNERGQGTCVPVRFVAACENGHLEEFPWHFFVHQGDKGGECKAGTVRLQLLEGPTGDFSDVRVRCNGCEAERRLSEARSDKGGFGAPCHGKRPWLPRAGEQPCDKPLTLVVKNASNTWFSAVDSALSIPRGRTQLEDDIETQAASAGIELKDDDTTLTVLKVINQGSFAKSYSDDELRQAIRSLLRSTRSRSGAEELRVEEHRSFMKADEKGAAVSREEAETAYFEARRCTSKPPGGIARVVKVEKLKEVRALIGFTRLQPPQRSVLGQFSGDERLQPANEHGDWLPAVEIRGEGVFIELDAERVAEWARRPAVRQRESQLEQAYLGLGNRVAMGSFPGARFYLLHSLAHALIQELSLECGYAASALRERIYCSPPGSPYEMNGILISTGTPGSEGTLGGLVEQADRLADRMRHALSQARICSNDPVCSQHDPGGGSEDSRLDGAACHACQYISESSCEWFNGQLDRAMLVPAMGTPAELAYFGLDRDVPLDE